PFERISSLDVWGSGEEKLIAFILKDSSGKEKICLFDIPNAKLKLLKYPVSGPGLSWTHDGKYIVFTSSQNGVPNLSAVDWKNDQVFRLTNVLGATREVDVFPANTKIGYTNVTAKAINLLEQEVDFKSLEKKEKEKKDDADSEEKFDLATVPTSAAPEIKGGKYNPFLFLFPKWWLPWVDLVEDGLRIGGITGGEDPLREWSYILNVGYDSRSEFVNWSASIDYRGFTPILSTAFSDFTFLISSNNIFQRDVQWRTSLTWPLDFLVETATFQPRFFLRNTSFTNLSAPKILFLGLGVGFVWENVERLPYSVTTEKGFRFLASIDRYLPGAIRNGFDYWRAIGSLNLYFPIYFPTRNSVIALRSSIGWTEGAPILYSYFQVGGELPYVFQNKLFLVRGFSVNKFLARLPLVSNFEWRIPISQVWRGLGTLPLFLRQVYFVPFFDAGTDDFSDGGYIYGTGAELRFNLTAAYHLPLKIRVGVHRGIGELEKIIGFVGFAKEF
ncbi:hypothetical protein ACFLRA_03855, partial [Bdellovibrionota bacterium]